MLELSDDELLKIANSQVSVVQQEQHQKLLEKNQLATLSEREHEKLTDLRRKTDKLMLRKAYAWAILKYRDCPVPQLDDLPEI